MQSEKKKEDPWWKTNQKIATLFERLFQPIEAHVEHDTRHRDIVGVLRQLDVGVIDNISGDRRVKSFVEVQRRKKRVGIQDLGSWIYKKDTLKAETLTILSEVGFSRDTVKHTKSRDDIKLGLLHPVETGFVERVNSTCLGIVRILDIFWFASVIVHYRDKDEMEVVAFGDEINSETKLFGHLSALDLVSSFEKQTGRQLHPNTTHTLISENPNADLLYRGRPFIRVILVVEKQRRIWEPNTLFYAYEGVYPTRGQQGIAIISDFRVDLERNGRLILVVLPKTDGGERDATIIGQIEFF